MSRILLDIGKEYRIPFIHAYQTPNWNCTMQNWQFRCKHNRYLLKRKFPIFVFHLMANFKLSHLQSHCCIAVFKVGRLKGHFGHKTKTFLHYRSIHNSLLSSLKQHVINLPLGSWAWYIFIHAQNRIAVILWFKKSRMPHTVHTKSVHMFSLKATLMTYLQN